MRNKLVENRVNQQGREYVGADKFSVSYIQIRQNREHEAQEQLLVNPAIKPVTKEKKEKTYDSTDLLNAFSIGAAFMAVILMYALHFM